MSDSEEEIKYMNCVVENDTTGYLELASEYPGVFNIANGVDRQNESFDYTVHDIHAHVVKIFLSREGVNDEEAWESVGLLSGGEFFYMKASCDYTGFDCCGGGDITLYNNMYTLLIQENINLNRVLYHPEKGLVDSVKHDHPEFVEQFGDEPEWEMDDE